MIVTWFLIAAHIAGLLTSIRAIMEVRTAQGTIAWVFALNAVPYLSVPSYWVFGSSRFAGYQLARRHEDERTSPTAIRYYNLLRERGLVATGGAERRLLVERLATMPFTTGNDAELLIDGEATFRSIFDGIAAAKKYVLVEFYILRDDTLGRELKELLMRKAQEGVRVYVLYDEIGSSGIGRDYLAKLTGAGAQIRTFNTRQGPENRWQFNFRNHRKIVVADGQTAWVGGHNVGDEYMGRDPEVGRWRDTHVRVTGPVVQGVQVAFLEDWNWSSGEVLELDWDPEPAASGARRTALCLPTGPADDLETCTLFFLNAINAATTRLWLATPYFVPDEQFVSALQLAVLRGVDVRILLPDKADNALVQLSGWSYVGQLEEIGVRFYRYPDGFMHQKVMLVDDRYCTIGTANFDNRSFRLNFEVTMVFVDEGMAGDVRRMLEEDFAGSHPITAKDLRERGFWYRFAVRCARLMAPVQ